MNVTDKNYLAVIDRFQGKITSQWHIAEAQQNAPLAFDEAYRRLFVVCREPGKLVVLDSSNGHSVATLPTGPKADEVVFDRWHHAIYVAASDGNIYPYDEIDADHYKALKPVASAQRAKTALLAPDGSHLYVAMSPGEAGHSAEVLVYDLH